MRTKFLRFSTKQTLITCGYVGNRNLRLRLYAQGISAMVFSSDETTNKAIVCAGVPEKGNSSKQLEVSEWLTAALGPVKGRCGKGKNGLATGQVS